MQGLIGRAGGERSGAHCSSTAVWSQVDNLATTDLCTHQVAGGVRAGEQEGEVKE